MLAALLLFAPPEASAGTRQPEKPIRLIVGFSAGSTVDAAARLIARKLAPAATPSSVIALLYRAPAKALLADEIPEKLDIFGMEVVGSTPDEFAAVIESESSFWARLIREAKITAE